ncbi:F0F1 ATP synthase subunit A [Saccharicrinis fermentans]|uniref:ATP synthase subunit a n=1 Tax=Saccharicrinis fermentans DSM 9555 = JCM 21142 TaxID=869213 RepID=W7Y4A8_9BACT|nr:F0F1 ATP synthase subunit A [Saccharicrinis fermentans]GAF02413.1 F-ATPase subunit 6 [Saccharicrinis fermentans DSM 9555 = JCM 21142]
MRKFLCVLMLLASVFYSSMYASEEEVPSEPSEKAFDPTSLIMHHISDAHVWHILSWGEGEHEKHIEIPLPIILYDQGQVHFFLYSKFDDDTHIAESKGSYFLYHHGKIYKTDAEGTIYKDALGHISNDVPLDFSLKRNVWSMWLSIALIIWIFVASARAYRAGPAKPKGIQAFVEPIILFVKEDIVEAQICPQKAHKFVPYLLTVFFFIWINNLLGLIPFFPGGSNFTGNISVTMVLAVITFLLTNINGSKGYWKHTLTAPGVPFFVKLILVPVEIIGLFTKPFALMIRLLANITAGHIVILSLVSLVFILKTIYISPVSVILSVIMLSLELLVAVLQAYIFTLLSALFIGMAVEDYEH